MNGDTDPRVFQVLEATPALLRFTIAYGAWLEHYETCPRCQTEYGGVANNFDRCISGDDLLRAANSLHGEAARAALVRPPVDLDATAEEPAALLGQPWRAPAEVAG